MKRAIFLFGLFLFPGLAPRLGAQSPVFTYQGRLVDGGQPANGRYDLQFRLADAVAGGNYVGPALTNAQVTASNGLFTVALDFGGAVFDGSARWLETGVRTNGSSEGYAILTPRQPVTSAPYAVFAGAAGVATTANNLVAGGSLVGNGAGLTNLNGGSLQAGTVNSNALDAATSALLGRGSALNAALAALSTNNGAGLTNDLGQSVFPANVTNHLINTNIVCFSGLGTIHPIGGGVSVDMASANGSWVWSGKAYTNGGFGTYQEPNYDGQGTIAYVITNAANTFLNGKYLMDDNAYLGGGTLAFRSTDAPAWPTFRGCDNWEDANGAGTLGGDCAGKPGTVFATNITYTQRFVGDGTGLTLPVPPIAMTATNAQFASFSSNALWSSNLPLPDFATRGASEPWWMIILPFTFPQTENYYHDLTNLIPQIVSAGLTNRGTTIIHVDDWWQSYVVNGVMQPNPQVFPLGIKAAVDACHTNNLKLDMYLKSSDLYGTTGGGGGTPYQYASTLVSNLVYLGVDGLEIDTSFSFGDVNANGAVRYGVFYKPGRLQALVRSVNEGIAAAWFFRTDGTPRPFIVWGGLARTANWLDANPATVDTVTAMINVFDPEALSLMGMYEWNWDYPQTLDGYLKSFKQSVFPYSKYLGPEHYLAGSVFSSVETALPFAGAGRSIGEQWREWNAMNAIVPSMVAVRSIDVSSDWMSAAYTNSEWWAGVFDRAYIAGGLAWSNGLSETWLKPVGSTASGTNLVTLVNRNAATVSSLVTAAMLKVSSNTVMQVRDPWFHTNCGTFTGATNLSVTFSNVWTYSIFPASGPVRLLVSGSPWLWTNDLGVKIQMFVWGGSGVTLGINGVQIGDTLVGTLTLPLLPGERVGITNTSPPNVVWKRDP